VDGIIASVTTEAQAEMLRRRRVPTVNIANRLVKEPFPTVVSDDVMIGRVAADHLLDLGLRHFAFVGSSTMGYDRQRALGFSQTIRKHGYDVTQCLTHFIPGVRGPQSRLLYEPAHLARQLEPLPNPVGIFTGSDVVGCGVLFACHMIGRSIPSSIVVVSCDNDELLCEMIRPGLSSVERKVEEIGYGAALLLDKLMDGEPPPAQPILIAPGPVVHRQSSDVLSVPDREVAEAVRFIRNHAAEPISVSDLLDAIPISRRLLEIRFRQHLGRTIHDEMRRAHVLLAKQLMEDKTLSLTEIARRSGFNYTSRFREAFRREVGVGPKNYRANLKSDIARGSPPKNFS